MATPNPGGGALKTEMPQATHSFPIASREKEDRRPRASSYDFHGLLWKHRRQVRQRGLEEELALAADIQARLFPAVLPELVNCELAARNRPAFLCGGDYYDVLPSTDMGKHGPHLLCVADVAGKGLAASLLMSNLQAILRTSLGYRPELINLATHTNRLLFASTPPDRYITAIMAHFEPATGKCTFVNAGHNGGLVIRADGEIDVLKTTGPPLGLMRDLPFHSERIELGPGEILNLYSDGVPEAFNSMEEEWGHDRLRRCLIGCRHMSPMRILSRVFEALDSFTGDAPQHDDITMLIVKRNY